MYHHSSSSRTFVVVALVFCISHNLPLIHSLAASNCVALPCTYTKECRDRFNTCGRGQPFCNSESLWLPACGGGGSFERPSGNDYVDTNDQNQSTTPPPTPLPTPRNTPNPTKTLTNVSTDGLPTLPPQPSSTVAIPPTPASIVSSAEQNGNGPKNEMDASTSHEDSGNYNPSNVAWFDKAGWDGRRQKDEDAGTNEALVMRRSSCVLLGLAAIIHLFMMLD